MKQDDRIDSMIHFRSIACTLLLAVCMAQPLAGQELQVNLLDFVEQGLERSGQLSYESRQIDLARNQADQARESRVLPSIQLNTNHGLVPGVVSQRSDLSERQYYLDPNLENDWENWAIFTRAELEAVQPVYAWGALQKAVKAAEAGAVAAEQEFLAKQSGMEVRLAELFMSYQLVLELETILMDAQETLDQVSEQIEEMREENNPDLAEKDVFQFEIFQSEFKVQQVELRERMAQVQRIWERILDQESVRPDPLVLEPMELELAPFDHYQSRAMTQRSEIQGVKAGQEAMQHALEATRARRYPMLYLGMTASFANTPNRPRQSNPFIVNNTNFLSGAIGFGIRQNLNFGQTNIQVERQRIEERRMEDLEDALSEGILLELSELYMDASVAQQKVASSEEALGTTRNWVRHEQLNYDYGFGNVEDLLEAVKKELELRVELKQNVFEWNKTVVELYSAAGEPLHLLMDNGGIE
ncbi:MAG: TolC family protein [Bacteroidota bacterium]